MVIFYPKFKIKTSKAYCETKSLIRFRKIKQIRLQNPLKSIFHEKKFPARFAPSLKANEKWIKSKCKMSFHFKQKKSDKYFMDQLFIILYIFFGKICCTFFCFFFCLIHFYSLLIIHCWAINIRHTVDEI